MWVGYVTERGYCTYPVDLKEERKGHINMCQDVSISMKLPDKPIC